MTAPDRLTRVNEILRRAIADYLELDPDLKDCGGLVSVAGVGVSCNLRAATVRISVMGSAQVKRTAMTRLAARRAAIQKRIARDLTMKFTPVLKFVLDENVERGDNVLNIIRGMEGNAEPDQ